MEENEAASGDDAPPPEHQGESGKAGPGKEGETAVPNHSFTPPDLFQMQELIPAYKFLEFVDRGGMGAVYRAHHPHLDRDIAVKLLPPNLREDPSFEKRFRREARTMAKLSHPNIVSVHDFGETKEGHLYIVMEYVQGSDLRRLIQKQELNAKDILPIITQVCDALQYAHDNKIVHRDIKPANILIDGNGVAKVADFGLAKPDDKDRELELSKVSIPGVGVGTPAYMAPEAIGESEIDHRADIFSFGVVIYEMITGTVPMGAWQPPSKTAGADMRFDDVVQRAMQAEPKDRYQQAGEIRHAFDEDNSNPGVGAQPAPQARSSIGKTIALVSVGLTLLLLAATALSWNGERFALLDVISPAPPPMSVEEFEKINREMSEWVFTKGGFVQIRSHNEDIYSRFDLPKGLFKVWRISLQNQPGFTDEDLQKLIDYCSLLPSVTNLNLESTSITPAGLSDIPKLGGQLLGLNIANTAAVSDDSIDGLGGVDSLELLILSKYSKAEDSSYRPITNDGNERLGEMLPGCQIEWRD